MTPQQRNDMAGRASYGAFSDPEAMARAMAHIPAWSSDPRPLAKPTKPFRATMADMIFDRFSVAIGGLSAPIPYTGATANQHTFMYPIVPEAVRFVSGRELFGNQILHLRANGRTAVNSPHDMVWAAGVIAVGFEQFRDSAVALTGAELGVSGDADRMFLVPGPAMTRLVGLTNDLARLIRDTPWVVEEARPADALSGSLLDALITCLATGRPTRDRAALRRHRVILGDFERAVSAHPEEALSLGAICRTLGVAARTLNLVCAEFLGESAMAYARGRRLDHVRARLLASDPATTRITEVATHFGFWELGRFAQAYSRRFGERPSQTLRRKETPTAARIRAGTA